MDRVKKIVQYGKEIVKPFKGVEITNCLTERGYHRVSLCGKNKYVHQIVATTFIPNPDNKPQVNHINGIKDDNRVENLEWVTNKENYLHSIKNGFREVFSQKARLNNIKERVVNGTQRVLILDTYTGIYYKSISQASKSINMNYSKFQYRINHDICPRFKKLSL